MGEKQKSSKNIYQTVMRTFSVLVLAAHIMVIALSWNTLPDKIPVHFNALGEADRYGGRGEVWIMAGVAILLYVIMTFTECTMAKNLEISIWNADLSMKETQKCIHMLGFILQCLFFYMSVAAIYKGELGKWFLPIFFILILLPTVIYPIRAYKAARR